LADRRTPEKMHEEKSANYTVFPREGQGAGVGAALAEDSCKCVSEISFGK
jgi:hypothetical protein